MYQNVQGQMSKVKVTAWKRRLIAKLFLSFGNRGHWIEWRWQNFDGKLAVSSLCACAVHIRSKSPDRLVGYQRQWLQLFASGTACLSWAQGVVFTEDVSVLACRSIRAAN